MISDGKVAAFDVHPNNDYLLVTSTKGRIYVFRIDTGELRGTIKIPLNSTGCTVDPSGLYVLVSVPSYSRQNTYNLGSDEHANATQDKLGHFATNQRNFERNTVLMFEIGTGMPAAEIASVFEIATMRFSPDGRYLALGSTHGAVAVWSMGNHLHQNVRQILDYMAASPEFWYNYPIFLPDYEQFNQLQRAEWTVAHNPPPVYD
jgi:WD40 repeat protein